ncbi:thymidylate synthase [Desulfobacca acetoxidans]
MNFIPLYFQDKLAVVNPAGTIGVLTLWSKVEYVRERFRQAGVDLDAATSPIAVFGTLYGNGLRELLRNLLYNPQIQTLVVCGRNRSGSLEELQQFFAEGLEYGASPLVSYEPLPSGEQVSTCRIVGTNRLIDSLVRSEHFLATPRVCWLGEPKDDGTLARIREFFQGWRPEHLAPVTEKDRQEIALPRVSISHFPSCPQAHTIVRDTFLEAWQELLFIISRFAHPVRLAKGERLELQNVKVVIQRPAFDPEEALREFHFDPEKLRTYQRDFLRGEKGADETYSYGNRLRAYFGADNLKACLERLRADPEDRKAYLTLWDNNRDLINPKGQPCFVSSFFRRFDEKLTLTATFRTHNALDAWLPNVYGLMALQQWVALRLGMPIGPITVVSHSISIDRKELDRALAVVGRRPFGIREDPCGYFRISLDEGEILVEHRYGDVTLKEYRDRKAVRLQHQLARDLALSDLNHAIYLGRQLARAEECLRTGREFEQE